MELKYRVDNLDGVDKSLHGAYQQDGEGYVLKVSGATSTKKVSEFRDNNIKLLKQIEDIQSKYKNVDIEKYTDMETKLQKIADDKLVDDGKTTELFNVKMERIRAEYEDQMKDVKASLDVAKAEKDTVSTELSQYKIDSEIRTALNSVGGLKKGALQDALGRGRQTWKLVEGKVTPIGQDGSILHDKDGEVLTTTAWAQGLVTDAPFLFENSVGGGAGGGANGAPLKTISKTDNQAFVANLEDIAAGKIKII